MTFQDEATNVRQAGTDGMNFPGFAGAGPFDVNIPVTRLYRAIGYLCNKDNKEIDPRNHPLTNGDIARVCVTPDDIAINQDNVRLRSIDSFAWFRNEFNITQEAVIPNAQAADRTEIFCKRGSIVCAFETNLVDDFYGIPGAVHGKGVVWLQFGPDSRRLQRLEFDLKSRPESRELQFGLEDFDFGANLLPNMEPGFAGASPFDVVVFVLPPFASRELYTCRAYECSYDNEEVISFEPKREGASIRMCVKPSFAAEQVGAKMWAVEWWTWSTGNLTQPAIVKQALEAPDGRTVQFCERGMDLCFFQTRLIPEFFKLIGNALNGDGVCWITFGDGFVFPGIMETENDNDESAQIDPSEDPLYAGSNPIGINFPTTGNWTPAECPPEDHSLKMWWEDEDENMRLVYILSMVAAGVALCCLWGFCLFCGKRKTDDEEKSGNVIINVDVKDTKNTESVMHRTEEQHNDYRVDMKTEDRSRRDRDGTECRAISKHDLDSGMSTVDACPEFNGKRIEEDVCFGDEDHPGTRDCRKVVRRYIKEHPDKTYGPEVFKKIKKKLRDRFLLVRNDGKKKWREAKKNEVMSSIGEIWMEQKRKMKSEK
jgi:hypothetical protein